MQNKLFEEDCYLWDFSFQRQEENDGVEPTIEGFEATNSEDEFGMRIVPALDPESGLEEDVDDMKARPIVIIEPCTNLDQPHCLKKYDLFKYVYFSSNFSDACFWDSRLCLNNKIDDNELHDQN